jgi:ribosomal protein L16 Arg81 hydroxylase
VKLEEAIAPCSLEDFKHKYFGRKPFALMRKNNPFESLVSLAEIEARLNDCCATLAHLAVVGKDGRKLPSEEVFVRHGARTFVRKGKLLELLQSGHSVVMHNMSEINPGMLELTSSIESEFASFCADLHVYISPCAQASGFSAHCDIPQHKVYLQLFGSTLWQVFRGTAPERALDEEQTCRHLELDFEVRLTAGSVLYLPPGVYHRVTNDEPRVSLSIPFHHHAGESRVERLHVPLTRMLRGG